MVANIISILGNMSPAAMKTELLQNWVLNNVLTLDGWFFSCNVILESAEYAKVPDTANRLLRNDVDRN